MDAAAQHSTPALSLANVTEAVEKISDRFPCRENEILELATLLSSTPASSPVMLQGPPSSGKSAIARQVLHELRIPHCYVSCIEHHRPRNVLQRILHQAHGGKRTRDGLYNAPISCANLADFLPSFSLLIKKFSRSFWIVLDDVQKLAGSDILLSLARLPEQGFNVGLLLISRYPWSMGAYLAPTAPIPTPLIIDMSQYRPSQLQKVILQRYVPDFVSDADLKLYKQLVQTVIPALTRVSCNLLDIQVALSWMWQRLEQSNTQGGATASSRINKVLKDMQTLIGDLELGGMPCGNINSKVTEKGGGAQGLAFELPYVSKLLLLSAYIASRNKATADRTVFDPSHSRRGRKSSQALDRQSEAAAEAVLRGPGPFSLERLLHIFYCLYEQHGPQGEDQVVHDGQTSPVLQSLVFTLQRADVGMQLSSLVTLRLLSTSRGDMLEGLTYRCHITEEVAYAIAANLKVQLTEYLCFTS